ncbi:MAG: hypothetical protein ABS35_40480 [Kaistia sp. SCN 65-12]|mgnify:CR=1 FL=1|nr:MAG: hypothetical protein ABS35_40480 [Kaistia sp. SCN 65-12]
MTVRTSGFVLPEYQPVADAFDAVLKNYAGGAAASVYVDGRPVLDLWGGTADTVTGRAWSEDTLTVIFSCTKGLMSLLAARLVAEGRLDYDAPVARYWADYAAAGKQGTLVRHLLAHQAGLSAPVAALGIDDIVDWERMIDLLAGQAPLWPPGAGHSYHFITHGWLVGEVLRRITGKSVAALLDEMIARPLGASTWIGLPAGESARVANIGVGTSFAEGTERFLREGSEWIARGLTLGGALPRTLASPGGGFNDPRLQAAPIPGAGGISDARSLARIWSAAVTETDGVRLIDSGTIGRATAPQSAGAPVFYEPEPWPAWGMGFQIDSPARRYLTPSGFGHDGAGGQVTFAEPYLRLGFAFITNQMEEADSRAQTLVDALRAVPELRRRIGTRSAMISA